MNYNRNIGAFLAVILLPQKGYMVSAIGGEQLAMKIFYPVSTCFLLTFYPIHIIYLLVMKTTKNYNSKK